MILMLGMVTHLSGADQKPTSTNTGSNPIGRLNPIEAISMPADLGTNTNTKVRFTYLHDVMPILMGKCVRCHNPEAKALPNWLDYKTAYENRSEIKRRVWNSWNGSYYKQPMPAGNGSEALTITEAERNTIKVWVETGAAYGVRSTDDSPKTKVQKMELGKIFFATVCASCHQPSGCGIPNRFPPLAGSDFLNADKSRAIRVLINGIQGEIEVNGQPFNNNMPSMPVGDEVIANTLTYVYNSFGNSGLEVSPAEVKALRGTKLDRQVATGQKERVNTLIESNPWE
jgi:mono/diheme cytochrome c family protein